MSNAGSTKMTEDKVPAAEAWVCADCFQDVGNPLEAIETAPWRITAAGIARQRSADLEPQIDVGGGERQGDERAKQHATKGELSLDWCIHSLCKQEVCNGTNHQRRATPCPSRAPFGPALASPMASPAKKGDQVSFSVRAKASEQHAAVDGYPQSARAFPAPAPGLNASISITT